MAAKWTLLLRDSNWRIIINVQNLAHTKCNIVGFHGKSRWISRLRVKMVTKRRKPFRYYKAPGHPDRPWHNLQIMTLYNAFYMSKLWLCLWCKSLRLHFHIIATQPYVGQIPLCLFCEHWKVLRQGWQFCSQNSLPPCMNVHLKLKGMQCRQFRNRCQL